MDELDIYYLKKNRNFIILILFMCLMVVVNIFALMFYVPYPYVEHTAKIVQIDDSVWFEFTINDNEVYRQATDKLDDVEVGDSITIYYHKNNPTVVRFTQHNVYYQNIILIALAVVAEIMVLLDTIYVFVYFRY